ncbi:MAG: hypothetical protein AAF787_08665 [Chloroflexota bacterium]
MESVGQIDFYWQSQERGLIKARYKLGWTLEDHYVVSNTMRDWMEQSDLERVDILVQVDSPGPRRASNNEHATRILIEPADNVGIIVFVILNPLVRMIAEITVQFNGITRRYYRMADSEIQALKLIDREREKFANAPPLSGHDAQEK